MPSLSEGPTPHVHSGVECRCWNLICIKPSASGRAFCGVQVSPRCLRLGSRQYPNLYRLRRTKRGRDTPMVTLLGPRFTIRRCQTGTTWSSELVGVVAQSANLKSVKDVADNCAQDISRWVGVAGCTSAAAEAISYCSHRYEIGLYKPQNSEETIQTSVRNLRTSDVASPQSLAALGFRFGIPPTVLGGFWAPRHPLLFLCERATWNQ